MKKVIGYFHTSATAPSQRKIAGVYKAAHEAGASVIRFDADEAEKIRRELAYWRPDGCIVDAVAIDSTRAAAFAKYPTVFLDCDRKIAPKRVSCLYRDSTAVAFAAADELLTHELAAYAYVSWPGDPLWSRNRGKAFVRKLSEHGQSSILFSPAGDNATRSSVIANLADWLKSATTPLGVFTATDALSEQVVEAAKTAGVSIPDQLMVIGVDDDEFFCEHTRPMLSSVSIDFEHVGERAVKILFDMIGGKIKTAFEPMSEVKVVRRSSTRRNIKHDATVVKAIDFIREHATEGIGAAEVAALFPCSRRLAERRFRSFTGRSILEEIHLVQIERAKKLIVNPLQKLSAIPSLCGFASPAAFQKLFKRITGLTLSSCRESIMEKDHSSNSKTRML